MEYQKLINLLDNTPINNLNLRQKNWSKLMMNHEERTKKLIKSDLKLQC